MNCKYCNSLRKNANSLCGHERLCKNNPDRDVSWFELHQPEKCWNKGLTKETDDRVKRNGESTSIAMKKLYSTGFRVLSQTQEFWTADRRKEKSEEKKKLYQDNPDSHPNRRLAGNKSKMTYPEKVAADWLDSKQIQYEHNKKVGKYYPDFTIDHMIIEIDGEYFHNKEYDKQRDMNLNELGYIVHRINSKERIINRLESIFQGVG